MKKKLLLSALLVFAGQQTTANFLADLQGYVSKAESTFNSLEGYIKSNMGHLNSLKPIMSNAKTYYNFALNEVKNNAHKLENSNVAQAVLQLVPAAGVILNEAAKYAQKGLQEANPILAEIATQAPEIVGNIETSVKGFSSSLPGNVQDMINKAFGIVNKASVAGVLSQAQSGLGSITGFISTNSDVQTVLGLLGSFEGSMTVQDAAAQLKASIAAIGDVNKVYSLLTSVQSDLASLNNQYVNYVMAITMQVLPQVQYVVQTFASQAVTVLPQVIYFANAIADSIPSVYSTVQQVAPMAGITVPSFNLDPIVSKAKSVLSDLDGDVLKALQTIAG